jgi:hypothetical protein
MGKEIYFNFLKGAHEFARRGAGKTSTKMLPTDQTQKSSTLSCAQLACLASTGSGLADKGDG